MVVLDGTRIAYADGRAEAPRTDEPETRVRTVMPGLWDCHVHFFGVRGMDLEEIIREPQALLAARASKSVEAVLRAGFTSVREVGGYGVYLALGGGRRDHRRPRHLRGRRGPQPDRRPRRPPRDVARERR